jgi:hypothetical protein
MVVADDRTRPLRAEARLVVLDAARRRASTATSSRWCESRGGLSWDKPGPAPCLSNGLMSPLTPFRTGHERAALQGFESAYEQWRLAEAALAEAEVRLWTEALRGADGPTCRRLGAETLALRDSARASRQGVLALLTQAGA